MARAISAARARRAASVEGVPATSVSLSGRPGTFGVSPGSFGFGLGSGAVGVIGFASAPTSAFFDLGCAGLPFAGAIALASADLGVWR